MFDYNCLIDTNIFKNTLNSHFLILLHNDLVYIETSVEKKPEWKCKLNTN